ncbi:putative siderophore iron transporter mirC [Rosellinia necatrix]|uniref:Putative siderophore iron transporter mirC n=1 Tax=Rosellinia necatrix TaxID=77044 RepID=A0A1W2TEQ2_ROSNE|nr:putative siderophore iron transporter mirC [Rosellinia necatrix]
MEHGKMRDVDDVADVSNTPSHEAMTRPDADADADADNDHDRPVSNSSAETQEGVKAIEAISMTWSKWGLIAAYLGIFLMAFTTSLEGQVTYSVVAFATSSFSSHSLIATVYVIQGVVNAVIKPPMAKIADVFGRLEAFTICIVLYVLGYIQMAASANVQTFAAAQIFYSSGSTGLQILQQVLIADTSDMLNRALLSSLPDVPFLVTTWIGAIIGGAIVASSTWRWAYGIWAIILPVVFLPLALTLFLNGRRAKRMALLPEKGKFATGGPVAVVTKIWNDLDIGGIVLLSAAFALILIPLTLAKSTPGGWQSPTIIALIVVGGVLLVIFPFWEGSKKLAPHPLIPLELLKSRTFCAGCAVGFFYFLVFYLSVQPYFYSYLLVVQRQSIPAAGHITQTFSFTATVTSIVVSLMIKYTGHYKYFVTSGSLIYLLGVGLMIRYRTEDASVGSLVGTQIAVGIGGGMLNVPAQLGVQASASHQQVAAATAVFLTLVEIGGAVGAAISGAVWTQLVPSKLAQYLPPDAASQAHTIFGNVAVASDYLTYPPGSLARIAINRSYQETMQVLLTIAVVLCAPLVLLSFLMRNYKLGSVEQGVKGKVIGGVVGENEKRVEDGDSPQRGWDPRRWFKKQDIGAST